MSESNIILSVADALVGVRIGVRSVGTHPVGSNGYLAALAISMGDGRRLRGVIGVVGGVSNICRVREANI